MSKIDPRKRAAGGPVAAASATPGAAMPGAPAPGAAPAAQPQQAGTGFVNLQRVLEANRGAAQSMGDSLAGRVQQAGQAGQQAIAQGQQQMQARTTEATLQYDAAKAPDKGAATSLAATAYQGPKGWEEAGVDVANAARLATAGADAANAVTTAGGRAALIRQGASGPLSSGGVALDSYLAGEGLGARAQLLQASFGSLAEQLAQARGGAGAMYEGGRAATEAAAGQYGQLARDFEGRAAADAARRAAAARRATAEERERARRARDLQDGNWTQEEAERQREVKERNRRGGAGMEP